MMPDIPNSMTKTTEGCSSHDNIFAIFSNLDSDSQPFGPSRPDELARPSSPAVSTDPEVTFTSPPSSPLTHLPNQASTAEPGSPDSTSTIEARDDDQQWKFRQLRVHHFPQMTILRPPPTYSFPADCRPVLSRPNQFKHRTETANSFSSRQNRREQVTPKPTAIIRPRINSRPRYSLKPKFDSWEIVFWDNQRKELTIKNTFLPSQRLVVPHQAITILPHQDS